MSNLLPERKLKIYLTSLLSSEKNPITSYQLRRRLSGELCEEIDPREYGFSTFDDLLCSFTEEIQSSVQNGRLVYMAKPTEANRDILDLVARQNDPAKHNSRNNLYNNRRNFSFSYSSNNNRTYRGFDNFERRYVSDFGHSKYNNRYGRTNVSMRNNAYRNINNPLENSYIDKNLSNDELVRRMINEIKENGDIPWVNLNERLAIIVNHCSNIFKLYLNELGKARVKLINDESNSNIPFKFGNLRESLESDVSWLADSQKSNPLNSKNEFNVYVISFIPPRGFLIIPKTEDNDLGNENFKIRLVQISAAIKKSNVEDNGPVKPERIIPGHPLALFYRNFFFRVIVLSGTTDSLINVVLVDYPVKYVTSAKMDQLYELPHNADLNSIEPLVKFCYLAGIEMCDETIQEKIIPLFDGYDSTVPAYVICDGDTIMIDILFLNSNNEYEWLTSIMKKSGSDISDNVVLPANYYSNKFMEKVHEICETSMILQFCDDINDEDDEENNSKDQLALNHREEQPDIREVNDPDKSPSINSKLITESVAEYSTKSSSSSDIAKDKILINSKQSISELFYKLIEANQTFHAFALYCFVNDLTVFSPNDFNEIKYHMKNKIRQRYGIIL